MKKALVLVVMLLSLATVGFGQKVDSEVVKANTEAGFTSQAAAAALVDKGHIPSTEEKQQLIREGKASKCGVITNPAGAEIYVDGNKGGVSPMVFVLYRKEFPRTVTLKLAGYKTVELPFIPNGKDILISEKLEKDGTTTPSVVSAPKSEAPPPTPPATDSKPLSKKEAKAKELQDAQAFLETQTKEAYRIAVEYLTATAKDPTAFKADEKFTYGFDGRSGLLVKRNPNRLWLLIGAYGRNSYGAVLRSSYQVSVVCNPGSGCRIDSVQECQTKYIANGTPYQPCSMQ